MACKKEDATNHKYYDSEIFYGENSKIYGNWEYIYTIQHNDWTGVDTKIELNLTYLNIKSIGCYERLKSSAVKSWEKGKIVITGTRRGHLEVHFCPDSSDCGGTREIFVNETNNLVIASPDGFGLDDWYKRVK